MSKERYPENLAVSRKDFLESGWEHALQQVPHEGYPSMWQAFSAAALSAIEQGRNEHGKVLWLLADACSMMLSPSSQNQPFKPYAVFSDHRSAIPDDLSQTDITFFSEIVDAVNDSWLKARLADLVWLKGKPRNTTFALIAIDAYKSLPLDKDTWRHGGRDCWPRAINLAKNLRTEATDRLEQMEALIVAAFSSVTRGDGFLGLCLAKLLRSNKLGCKHLTNVAEKLEAFAREFDDEGDLRVAREYFSAAVDWYKATADETKAVEMNVAVAEGWAKEADARSVSDSPSHIVAASFYEKAIQTYRLIPNAYRALHQVNERINELRSHLNDSGEKSLGEMVTVRTDSVDVTKEIENARKLVTGKSVEEALLAFVNLYPGVNAEDLRRSTLMRMDQHPLSTLFPTTKMSRDGRVIAKRPAMSLDGAAEENDEIAICAEMVHDYAFSINIVVQCQIYPALEVLLLEHRLCEADFVNLARQSPILPKDRAGLFGKALFAGYELDFVTALHLLIPQIEHLVRVYLKQAGAKTTTLDRDGIENENGMSTLMGLPEAEKVFGRNIAFELKSLFCDAFGPNLRNELAHGLLDEDGCKSTFAIYAWWMTLRFTFNTWWNVTRKSNASEDSIV
ncbi:DUF4209 domain-containing protein [Chitinimonas sp. PSY-7]|uniref:DUF4209 domain-containing protein n=1 Tax=Chitinimonas sp. PSY-7 TaxID=3459088 RepID=UPI00403FE42C